jgi:Sulfate permease family
LSRWLPKIPAVLIMVVLAIISTTVFSLADHGVSLVGVLPKGFPSLTIPHVSLADLRPLFARAAGIALASLADTICAPSASAARTGQEIHGNQEMTDTGAASHSCSCRAPHQYGVVAHCGTGKPQASARCSGTPQGPAQRHTIRCRTRRYWSSRAWSAGSGRSANGRGVEHPD